MKLYPAEQFASLYRPPELAEGELCRRIRELLAERGASFYPDIARQLGGFEPEVFAALWRLVWASEVTNDTLSPLRSLSQRELARQRPVLAGQRTRRIPRAGSEGRWSLLDRNTVSDTEYARAFGQSLLLRYGIVTREALKREALPGGFATLYPVLRAMEEAGQVRRGYFVEGLGGVQFAYRGAEGRLRKSAERALATVLAACDPANPYGAALPWPAAGEARLARVPSALVILERGQPLAYISRQKTAIHLFFEQGDRGREAALLAALAAWFDRTTPAAWSLESIDGQPALGSAWARLFEQAGFTRTSSGLRKLRSQA